MTYRVTKIYKIDQKTGDNVGGHETEKAAVETETSKPGGAQ